MIFRAKDSLGEVAVNGTSQSTTDDSQTDTGVSIIHRYDIIVV